MTDSVQRYRPGPANHCHPGAEPDQEVQETGIRQLELMCGLILHTLLVSKHGVSNSSDVIAMPPSCVEILDVESKSQLEHSTRAGHENS
jgi:hypothetical protein